MKLFMSTSIIAVALLVTQVDAAELTPEQVMNAACRVTVPNGGGSTMGSGTVIHEDANYYYVMTNAHVAKNTGNRVTVEFYRDGFKSPAIPGVASWVEYHSGSSIDFALIAVQKSYMNGYEPRIIKFASLSDGRLEEGQLIYGAGCPAGKWLQFWKTRVINNNDPNMVNFAMPPVGGQSGSAILATVSGETRVVGLLTWRFGNTTETEYGGGASLQRIADVMGKNAKPDRVHKHYVHTIHETSHDSICEHCGRPKSEHRLFVNRKTRKPISNYKLYCKDNHLRPNEEYDVATAEDIGLFKRNDEVQRPPVGDLFPDSPAPPFARDEDVLKLQSELDEAKKKVAELEDVLNQTLDDRAVVEQELEKKKEEVGLLSKLKDAIFGEKEQLEDKVENLNKENQKLADSNEALSKELKTYLDNINIPYVSPYLRENFGLGLGSFISWIFALVSSGTLVHTAWGKFVRPYMLRKYGWLPVQLIEMIGKDRLDDFFSPNVKQEVKHVPMSGGYAVVKNVQEKEVGDDVDLGRVVNEVYAQEKKRAAKAAEDKIRSVLAQLMPKNPDDVE